nr:hypothetical protein [Candidatus Freyarchaeota archaeon]
MRTKKLIAITIVILFALLLIPVACNALASNQWTPILLQQVNTQPKQTITTEPLGNYIHSGDKLTYTARYVRHTAFPSIHKELEPPFFANLTLIFSFTSGPQYGNWSIVNWTIVDQYGTKWGIYYFAIDNITREVGLNSTGGLFPEDSPPLSVDNISRQTGVYSFLALPTGIKAGDSLKILAPRLPEDPSLVNMASNVVGRITTPIINFSLPISLPEFYDTWMLQGTWREPSNISGFGELCSMAFSNYVKNGSGLCVSTFTSQSVAYFNTTSGNLTFWSSNGFIEFNSTLSTPNRLAPLKNTTITNYTTAENPLPTYGLTNETFKYDESGYWCMNYSVLTNGTLGTVRFDSLPGSYFNWTLSTPGSYYTPIDIGFSQVVSIPTDFWNYKDSTGWIWNPNWYNASNHTGRTEYLLNGTNEGFGMVDFMRLLVTESEIRTMAYNMLLASPYLREGVTILLLLHEQMFWPNNATEPWFGYNTSEPLLLLIPCQVSGAVRVSIGVYDYDCWKVDSVLPNGLSSLNVTQFQFTVYFERTSGVLIKAKTDIEMNMPWNEKGDKYLVPFGYHKTWTLASADGGSLPSPGNLNEFSHNLYNLTAPANVEWTLDPSFFTGGSVTVKCNETVNASMWTQIHGMALNDATSIAGKPVVKAIVITHPSSSAAFNATVNFYYTPSELSARGVKESGFTIYAWNTTAWAWEPLNTTVDYNGRVVSANTTHFSVFALVAAELSPLSIWDILGPVGLAVLLNSIDQASRPMGGMLPILGGIGVALVAVIAVAVVMLARRH